MNFLEAESIEIIREGVATARTPVMMYSIGKDSSVMLQLARKAFYSGLPPFPLLHIDTGWKFQAMYQHRGCVVAESGMTLITHINQQGLADGVGPFTHGSSYHTDVMKTQALKQALDANGFDLVLGGARRDEEKSRAKERIVSFRTLGCWPLTAAIESEEDGLEAVIAETLNVGSFERQGRLIDSDTPSSMEKKKQEGYF